MKNAIDFDDLGLCEYGVVGPGPGRDPDACPNAATNVTEEGYCWCLEHAQAFYEIVAFMKKSS